MALFRNKSDNKRGQLNLSKELFWDWRYDETNWEKAYRSVIERVLERGTDEEWHEIIRYYGERKIIKSLKKEIKFLPDHTIEKVIHYFNLKKEQLACYIRKQSRQGQWI